VIVLGAKMTNPHAQARVAPRQRARIVSDDGPRTCECGTPTKKHHRMCRRCRFLEQARSASMIVSVLREHRVLTIVEIAHCTRQSRRNTLRSLQRMLKIGRCARALEEVECENGRGTQSQFVYWLTS
jgi:hypothetical protein